MPYSTVKVYDAGKDSGFIEHVSGGDLSVQVTSVENASAVSRAMVLTE